MWIRRVTAHAFGPLRGATLELAPGLTVIHGPNESGKSTWHAAIHAALCGRRRGGGATARDREFADRRRPWGRDDWRVTAEVRLADGRRVELHQELDRRVDCHAKDLDLGTDLSAEIMHDGAPDASRWLGLDRRSFEATAFVAQARMLDVLRDADGLQAHLQRAAATAGTDATAAGALRHIDTFRAEQVGRAQANSVRPLQRAIVARRSAAEHLARARAWHQEHERRAAAVQLLREQAATAQERLDRCDAAALHARAQARAERAGEAAVLDRRLREAPPDDTDPGTEAEVAAALAAWEATAARATGAEPVPADPALADHELWDLARRLELSDPLAAPTPDLAAARADFARAHRAGRRAAVLAVAGAALAVAAAAAMATGTGPVWSPATLAVATLLGVVVTAAGLLGLGRTGRGAARAALAAAEASHAAAREAVAHSQRERSSAEHRCAELSLPADPGRLRDLARVQAGADGDRDRSAAADAAVVALAGGLATAAPPPVDVGEAVGALRAWQAARATRTARAEQHRRDRARLAALLDGATVESLAAEAAVAAQRAGATGYDRLDVRVGGADRADGPGEEELAESRAAARSAAERLATAEGSLEERRGAGLDVAVAEEVLAHADAEEARVRRLDDTLARTREFLAAAQARVHRDIAPALADSVRRRLPVVTAGRYTDVIVDPADLQVQVCGPDRRWRRAELLSHGTAEQIYLLLRIALAEQLARLDEPCPLILDDVVAHADDERAGWLLGLLREVARERQVVLFTTQPPPGAAQDAADELRIALDRVAAG